MSFEIEYSTVKTNHQFNSYSPSFSHTTTEMAVEKRNVVFLAIVLEIEGREDITLDISTPDSRKKLSEHPVTLKEGATFQLKIVFRVRLEVIRGLNYLEEKKRQGTLIEKSETLMVSSDVIIWLLDTTNRAYRVHMPPFWRASLILK